MKKLISLLTSMTLCVGAMSALPANAGNIAIHMGIVITQDELAGKFIVHKGLEELGKPGFYQYVTEDGRIGDIWQAEFNDDGTVKLTLWTIDCGRFIVTSDVKNDFVKYVEENYPNCTLEIHNSSDPDIAYVYLTNAPVNHRNEKECFEFAFMKNALLAMLLLTPLLALLGTMAVNRRMAFFSDALGHSALTGIAIGMVLGISNINIGIKTSKSHDSLLTNSL